uniref:Protein kinase domain-containing protein n=1 Tax=Leersia perrieri TaxID=77586 RepID=A0A0D9XDH4_9ORYZ
MMPRVLVVIVALCLAAGVAAAQDIAGDTAALLAFRDAVGRRLPWPSSASSSSSPCGWRGVRCDAAAARVVALQLPGASLVGTVPTGTVGNLTALRTLSLRSNALSGEIPADIGNCGELRAVYLHDNRLSGEIPEGIFSLRLLQRLDLSGNRVGGSVSPEFSKLRRLATLYLQNNSFNGTLPGDLDLPNIQLFNVSYNEKLTGAVPDSLAGRIPASAFSGTGLCGGPLTPCTNPSPPSPLPSPPISPPPAVSQHSKSSKLSGGAIAGIAVGGGAALLVALAVIVLLCFKRRRRKDYNDADENASPPVWVTVARTTTEKQSQSETRRSTAASGGGGKKLVFVGGEPEAPYDLETLLHASAEVVGKGWLGTTYRATLDAGVAVAVKRLRDAPIPEREFRDRVAALASLRHVSLAPIRAFFYSRGEKLLVSDFVGAASLSSLLHTNRARLSFTSRARVALAAARGVAFIHRAAASAVSCHGNIKSSNVVVNASHDGAFLTDYGLVQLIAAAGVPLKRVTGYRAPELTEPTREADVYSFGVLMLEMLTGRAPANAVAGMDGVDLPNWVRSVVEEEWTAEVFDAAIADEMGHAGEEMVRMLRLAVECTDQRPERRPAMDDVAARIERIVESAVRNRNADVDDFESVSDS